MLHFIDKAGLLELARADVDRQRQMRAGRLLLPAIQLLAGNAQNVLAERHDQLGIFRQRNEITRPEHAFFRVLPAHQRLGADHPSLPVYLRLIQQEEIAMLQPLVDRLLQRHARQHAGLHFRIEELEPVAAAVLGAVHRQFGLLQQFFLTELLADEQHGADRGGDAELLAANGQRLIHIAENLGADTADTVGGIDMVVGQRFQQHQEFIAAKPRHQIVVAHALLQPPPRFAQQLVAGAAALGMFEPLEVVQIDEQQGTDMAAARTDAERLAQPVARHAPVGQTGQAVVERQGADFLLCLFLRGNILRHDQVAGRRLVGAGQHIDAQVQTGALPVAAQLAFVLYRAVEGADLENCRIDLRCHGIRQRRPVRFADQIAGQEIQFATGRHMVHGDHAGLIQHQHHVLQRCDHRRQLRFALAQIQLGALAPADVHVSAHHLHRLLRRIEFHRLAVQLHPDKAVVLVAHADFRIEQAQLPGQIGIARREQRRPVVRVHHVLPGHDARAHFAARITQRHRPVGVEIHLLAMGIPLPQALLGTRQRQLQLLAPPVALQHILDPRQQDRHHDRLVDVILGPLPQPLQFAVGRGIGGNENHCYVAQQRMLAHEAMHLVTAHARHHHIQQHQIGSRFECQIDGFLAGGSETHVIIVGERLAQHHHIGRNVIDDENL